MSDLSEVFNDSWERTQQNNSAFIDSFYNFFMNSSDEVKDMFVNTDMTKQKKMLQASLLYITSYRSSSLPTSILEKLKSQHIGLKITIQHYDTWMNCIIKAVEKVDPHFNKKTEQAWRETFRPGLEFMKDGI